MQDQPQVSAVAKDVSNCQTKLKELLVSGRDPWDKDTELVRQRLRKAYLQLLFNYPYAPQSKKVDTRMWLDTSHALISVYKERLAALEKVLAAPSAEGRGQSRSRHGPVEHRKLAQRFRQFLAEEEKFWIAFVTRFVRLFALEEARTALVALGIDSEEPEQEPSTNTQSRSRWLLFPPESSPLAVSANQRAERLLILSKALVCIGDVARYREQWNESGGRPKGGKETHDDAPKRGMGRNGRREPLPRPRNYSRARECYERARAIFPESGNASHQLAILASYESDSYNSLYHYYRSLCVKAPYTAALENLEKQMHRYLEQHPPSTLIVTDNDETPPRERVDKFKEFVMVLHSLWRSSDTDTDMQRLSDDVITELKKQVTDRVLPSDLIVKTVILAIGALWTHRMYRKPKLVDAQRGIPIEALIQIHILDIFRVLGQVGISQLTEVDSAPPDITLDIAQHITAVLRRMLPALRVCSKWVRTNLDSLRMASLQSPPIAELGDAASKLWDTYIDFASLLLRVFPLESLKPIKGALEEDVDLEGFAPLKSTMIRPSKETASGLAPSHTEVHPNEEQLMRIYDLLQDAMALSQTSYSPIVFENSTFSLRREDPIMEMPPPIVSTATMRPPPSLMPHRVEALGFEEQDDDAATVSTDPVGDAMNATLSEHGYEDDEELILYPKNLMTPVRTARPPAVAPSKTPVNVPINPLTPHTYVAPLAQYNGVTPLAPLHPSSPGLPIPAGPATPITSRPTLHGRTTSGTTAGDLVAQFLGGRHLGEAPTARKTSGTPLLFGTGSAAPTSVGGGSIWSTGFDGGASSPLLGGMFPSTMGTSHLPTSQPHGISPPLQQQTNMFSQNSLPLGNGAYPLGRPPQTAPPSQMLPGQSSQLSGPTQASWASQNSDAFAAPFQTLPNLNSMSKVPPTHLGRSGSFGHGLSQGLHHIENSVPFVPSGAVSSASAANLNQFASYGHPPTNGYSPTPMSRSHAAMYGDEQMPQSFSNMGASLGIPLSQDSIPPPQTQHAAWPPPPASSSMLQRGWS
ncbi:hypothetical protein BKA62DRAFT_703911 [Auriculariales sp. MPI-PUGE-AT-0066]|nr:hypothetical protein BKA62DRAFT_703911 [Auriculariales sp. MPI-PUGE-AT-0066]